MKINWSWLIKKLNGQNEYQKYLKHFEQHHSHQIPLTKQRFFAQKETEKWNKINRCC
ncbi:MAG: YbdD/YjiX family protein [Pseudomonadota bacterium]